MFTNTSPWVEQLKNNQRNSSLEKNHKTNILVIGAGISGITTAYYLLTKTNLKVTLVEAKTLASGATGHNAGQLVSYFEKQIVNLVKEFGFEQAIQAQKDINSAWYLLEEIYQNTGLTTKISIFNGYAGIQSYADLVLHLKNAQIYKKAGLIYEKLSIADDCPFLEKIPEKYNSLFSVISRKNLGDYLETEDNSYIGMISIKKGVLNSALFCEDLLEYLLKNYSNRFHFFERTPIQGIDLLKTKVVALSKTAAIEASKVVLCTNGFENFEIKNSGGEDINSKFHYLVKGCVGYMAGYLEKDLREPTAISYLPKSSTTGNESFDADPYFYLTRRDYDIKNQRYNLICVGGPESILDDTNDYKRQHPYPAEAQENIDNFLHTTYKNSPKGEINYKYKWHGLMGYTPNGVRIIGTEPLNKNLLYNLGCNGIGILPSIYGSSKIARIVAGEKFGESIFDPKNF
jgi:glycine/D-amino acid oxidase-like deaminating enzyme